VLVVCGKWDAGADAFGVPRRREISRPFPW
jgi:hypothetical protein